MFVADIQLRLPPERARGLDAQRGTPVVPRRLLELRLRGMLSAAPAGGRDEIPQRRECPLGVRPPFGPVLREEILLGIVALGARMRAEVPRAPAPEIIERVAGAAAGYAAEIILAVDRRDAHLCAQRLLVRKGLGDLRRARHGAFVD